MASAPMPTDSSRMSFAKVAASAGKENVALTSYAKSAASNSVRDVRREIVSPKPSKTEMEQASPVPVAIPPNIYPTEPITELGNVDGMYTRSEEQSIAEASLIDAVKAMNVNGPMPNLVVNGSGTTDTSPRAESTEGFSEDAFHRTDSGSELGTKPPSLDGKSITSGTTFALDEKESLRPDDSASVKAAEDDDTFSARGSIVAGSRIGSEAAARAYRAQSEANERRGIQALQERQSQGVITPQSSSSSQQIVDGAKLKPLTGTPDAFNLFYRQTPDEKLLEALESPKDRIFLLRLEQDVIEFVKDSNEPFIDLPPCNSFCRMLTHKLADYYHMTHQVDAVAGAVRIFRTPFCRLPPSLTSISNPPTSGNTPPPAAMKIMRRGGDGDTGPSTSKAASETGSDGKEKSMSAKEKLSREEREAAYLRARERIFGKEEEKTESPPETENGDGLSRSSSVSAKDKYGQGKKSKAVRRERKDDTDDFDPRSQYTPFFPQAQVPTWMPAPQYPSMVPPQFNGPAVVQSGYHNQIPQQFGPQNQQFNPDIMSNGAMQTYNMPQFPQPNQPRFGQQPHSAPITAYGSPNQSPPAGPQPWQQQSLYQNQYQQPRGPSIPQPQSSVPYAYGQLPSTANSTDPKSQHPIPGSFNRHNFNPKTQSFVPGSNGRSIPQLMSHQGSPHHGSPHLSYNNSYTPPYQHHGNGMGYSMTRQGSNNSLPSYHASPQMLPRPMMHQAMPPNMQQGFAQNQGMPQGTSNMQGMPPQNGHFGSHLPTYGNPATLPPKPPS